MARIILEIDLRRSIEQWLESIWYGDRPPPWVLRALVPLYRLGFWLDCWWGKRQQPPELKNRCIIVVGNLTAGGTGKTPVVIHLCRLLRSAGLKPGVISRGYGRNSQGERKKRIVPVSAETSPEIAGDEAVMIARRAGVPVLVGADRARAALLHFAHGLDVVISDDGLQHHRLPRSMEICVVDGMRGFGNQELIPAGPLRESLQRLQTVDDIVVNNAGISNQWRESILKVKPANAANGEELACHAMDIVPGLLKSLDGAESWRLSQFRGCKANAVAGIGNNQRFFALLEKAGIIITARGFGDHHRYDESDFTDLDSNLPIIMTEKDAIKCAGFGLSNAWYLVIDTVLPEEFEDKVLVAVRACQSGDKFR
jgi:tetraacyldisaccharide 4'-kinase